MGIVFVHGHKFRKIDDYYYSPGGLSNEILTRYTEIFGEVNVIGRIINEEKSKSTYSKIVNEKINIYDNKDMYNLIKKSDAVIIRLPSINGYKAAYYANKLKKPYLIEVVGCVKDSYLNYGIKGKICAYPAYYVMRQCVKKSKYTVYVTQKFLQSRYPSGTKSIGISDVALKNTIKPNIKNISRNESIKIGTLAAIDVPYKGQEYMIRAIPLLEKQINKKIEYQLVGSGSKDKLQILIDELGLQENVKFIGGMPHEKVFEWLHELDIYIQPSLLEGLSRSLIEAMSCGLICIASKCGGNPELLDEMYLFDIRSKKNIPENICKVIETIVDNHEYEQIQMNNYNFAYDNFNLEYLNRIRSRFYIEFRDSYIN